jgi:uncharacterized protein YbaR (Trm112 family)
MQELLDILRCPETHQPFQIADAALVADLNSKIKAGQLKNRAGKPITDPIESGLLRQDRKFLYPIRKSIPVLLIDEAIPL